jgi:hypothetical protein
MPRPFRLFGLWLGLSAGAAWGQQPPLPVPPPASPRPVLTNGFDLGLLERPPAGMPSGGGFLQGTGRLAEPAGNRVTPSTFGSSHIRPVGDWNGGPAGRRPDDFPRVASSPLGPAAQAAPVRPAGYAVPAAAEPLVPFDAASIDVRFQGGRWVWTDGRSELRDFGPHQAEARAALQMARELRPTHYGAIGAPRPALEYWLTDGKAPAGILSQREVVPFEPDQLRVEQLNGVWVLRDPAQVLCNFGANADDAQRALAVCQRYGFNQIGLIGRPSPVMAVLLFDANRAGLDRTRLTAQQAKPLPREALHVPNLGWVGELVTFDARRLEVARRGSAWVLRVEGWELAAFGLNEMDAHLAARTLQDLRINQYCRLGPSGFGFFLTYNRAPAGVPLGLRVTALRRDRLDVREVNGSWVIADGPVVLYEFGPHAQDAQQALNVIRHFGFDAVCRVGHGPRALSFLLKSR